MNRRKLLQSKKKLNKLHGLLTFAMTSGFILAIQLHTGIDISESGVALTVMEKITESMDSSFSYLIPLLSGVATISHIGVTIHHVKTAAKHRHRGILVSGGGFFGMIGLILGSVSGITPVMYLGLIGCVSGALTAQFSD